MWLTILRHGHPRYVHLLGRRLEIVQPWWTIQDFIDIFWTEHYHFKCDSPRPRILDCGANIGLATLYFKLLFPESDITAFEPDPALFEILRRNVGRFSPAGVTLEQRAVWIAGGNIEFSGDGGVGGRIDGTAGGKGAMTVRAARLADFLHSKVDLLKLDIEGAEHEVLRDCVPLLGNVRRLFLEFHGRPERPQELDGVLKDLREAGFRYYVKDARGDRRPLDFDWRRMRFDIQVNVYCVRESD